MKYKCPNCLRESATQERAVLKYCLGCGKLMQEMFKENKFKIECKEENK